MHTLVNSLVKFVQDYDEQEVAPLHLACTATTMFDTFPVKADMNFSKHFGLESEAFNTLQSYLLGHNVEGNMQDCSTERINFHPIQPEKLLSISPFS